MLLQLLQGEDYENWEKWISEDLRLWETENSTEHHINAYGGMGSFNDVVIGGQDINGIWKSKLFGIFQTLAWSYAKKSISTIPLEEDFYTNHSNEISGWRCRKCGKSKIYKKQVEQYLCAYFFPKLIVEHIKKDEFQQLLNYEIFINSDPINKKRKEIEYLIKKAKIELNELENWNWVCPVCNSSETCSYRWILTNNDTQLVEADDNLELLSKS